MPLTHTSARSRARTRTARSKPKPPSKEWVQFGPEQVLLVRKQVKNLYMRVKAPDGHLELTVPSRMPEADIRAFVSSRWAWVERNRQQLARSKEESARPADYRERSQEAKALISQQLPALLDKWVPIVGKKPTAISLRQMSTRWGSCTPATGRIRLNLELAWMKPEFLEYVLVHELTHLHVHGHGPQFQALMDSYLPDWRAKRREINRHVIV